MTALASAPPGFRPIDPYEDAPPDVSFEVVNGVRVEKHISVYEQAIASRLDRRLGTFCEVNNLGNVVLEAHFALPGGRNTRKPDVAFVAFTRWADEVPRERAWAVAPDLAVEVVSPTDMMFDVIDKLHEYFRAGVRQVWLVFSGVGQVYVYTSPSAVSILDRTDTISAGDVIPGFSVPVAELFPGPGPAQ